MHHPLCKHMTLLHIATCVSNDNEPPNPMALDTRWCSVSQWLQCWSSCWTPITWSNACHFMNEPRWMNEHIIQQSLMIKPIIFVCPCLGLTPLHHLFSVLPYAADNKNTLFLAVSLLRLDYMTSLIVLSSSPSKSNSDRWHVFAWIPIVRTGIW